MKAQKISFSPSILILSATLALQALGAPDEGRAKNYQSELNNQGLFNSIAQGETTQASAFVQAENLGTECMSTALNGRNDALCENNPNHPECAGLGRSVDNASTCIEWFDPATKLNCKTYGAHGYTLEEWLAFGSQYQRSINECNNHQSLSNQVIEEKFDTGAGTVVVGALSSLTGSTTGNTQGLPPSSPRLGESGVSQGTPSSSSRSSSVASASSGRKDTSTETQEAKPSPVSDGSLSLGYESGEVLRRTLAGESFQSIVTDSPFASRLKARQSNQMISALNDADAIVAGVRMDESRNLASRNGTQDPRMVGNSEQISSTASMEAKTSTPVPFPGEKSFPTSATDPMAREIAAKVDPAPAPLPNESAPRLMQADRIAAIEAYAKAKREGRKVASLEEVLRPFDGHKASEKDLLSSQSLFERIRSGYRRFAQRMKALESSPESRKVQSLDRPQIFK